MWFKIFRLIDFINTPGAFLAWASWSKFSLASYKIISRAKLQGVYPKTVIDVGANVGQFSVASNKLFTDAVVYPIEPDPQVAVKLRKNIGMPTSENILISAIGDYVGKASFQVNRDSQVSSLLHLGADRLECFPNSTVAQEISVPITTLDVLFQSMILIEPVLLKIDVQGFEDRVISGATEFLKRVQWVIIEVSFASLYEGERDFESIINLMKEHNFFFIRPLNFHISPKSKEIIEMDALFLAKG